MKLESLVSAIFVLVTTILYFIGTCRWDLWVYLLSIVCAILFMLIFLEQKKSINRRNREEGE